jgi:hypothetical protein
MPVSQFLRDRLQAYSDNTIPTLLIGGGSVAIGWLIQTYGHIWGLDPKVAFVLAWVVALVVALGLNILLKPKSKPEQEQKQVSSVRETPPLTPPQPININIDNKPVFNNSPHIDQRPVNYQTQSQSQDQSIDAAPRDPVFEFTDDARLPLYGINWETKQIIRESPSVNDIAQLPDYITVAHAILMPFYYRPNRGVDHTVYLSAHVSVFTPDKKVRLKRIIGGIWDGDPFKSSSRIQTGHTLELLMALAPVGTVGIISAEYHQQKLQTYMGDEIYDAPRLEVIKGEAFKMLVELLPKRMSKDPFPIQKFWFNLELVTGVIAAPKVTFIELET